MKKFILFSLLSLFGIGSASAQHRSFHPSSGSRPAPSPGRSSYGGGHYYGGNHYYGGGSHFLGYGYRGGYGYAPYRHYYEPYYYGRSYYRPWLPFFRPYPYVGPYLGFSYNYYGTPNYYNEYNYNNYPNNGENYNGYDQNPPQGQMQAPGQQQANAPQTSPAGPSAMPDNEYQRAKSSIQSKASEYGKLTIAEEVADNNNLNTEQVRDIMNSFASEDSKLEFAKYAYDHTIDKGNYYIVNDAFTSDASIKSLNKYISKRN